MIVSLDILKLGMVLLMLALMVLVVIFCMARDEGSLFPLPDFTWIYRVVAFVFFILLVITGYFYNSWYGMPYLVVP